MDRPAVPQVHVAQTQETQFDANFNGAPVHLRETENEETQHRRSNANEAGKPVSKNAGLVLLYNSAASQNIFTFFP